MDRQAPSSKDAMQRKHSSQTRQNGQRRVTMLTNVAIAGAVLGTGSLAAFVAHEYGSKTTTTSTTTPSGSSTSNGGFIQTPSNPDDSNSSDGGSASTATTSPSAQQPTYQQPTYQQQPVNSGGS